MDADSSREEIFDKFLIALLSCMIKCEKTKCYKMKPMMDFITSNYCNINDSSDSDKWQELRSNNNAIYAI
jgi:hypothetical protein